MMTLVMVEEGGAQLKCIRDIRLKLRKDITVLHADKGRNRPKTVTTAAVLCTVVVTENLITFIMRIITTTTASMAVDARVGHDTQHTVNVTRIKTAGVKGHRATPYRSDNISHNLID